MTDAERARARARAAMDRLIADAQAQREENKVELSELDELKQSMAKRFFSPYKKYGL